MLVRFKAHAIKQRYIITVLFSDSHNKDLCNGLSASQCYLGRNSWLATIAMWSKVLAC